MPGAEAALMVVGLRSEDCIYETRNSTCSSENGGTRDGILFVRHGGGAAAAGCSWFGEFSDFGLHVQREIASDFVQRAGQKAESRGNFGDAVAMRVPGSKRKRERQLLCKKFGDHKPLGAESGESADGASELKDECGFLELEQPIVVTEKSIKPSGNDETEGSRKCLLQQGTSNDRCGAVSVCK